MILSPLDESEKVTVVPAHILEGAVNDATGKGDTVMESVVVAEHPESVVTIKTAR